MARARRKGALIYLAAHFTSVGDRMHPFWDGDLSAIDKLVTWITQIIYFQNVIQYQLAK